MRIKVGAAVLATLAICASGCATSDGATTEVRDQSALEADRQSAESAVLTIDDVPFASTVKGEAGSDVALFGMPRQVSLDVLDCMQVDASKVGGFGPWAQSPEFQVMKKGTATSRVKFDSTVALATATMQLVHNTEFASCTLGLPQAAQSPDRSIEPLPFPKLGDDTIAYRATKSHDGTPTAVLDMVVTRVGRALISMTFEGYGGQEFHPVEAQRLTHLVIDRLPR